MYSLFLWHFYPSTGRSFVCWMSMLAPLHGTHSAFDGMIRTTAFNLRFCLPFCRYRTWS
ncbi:hypothetical protein BDR03DRAFT_946899 [Suillus americanus]|nr:hypothetical protein BDR03DRAFT_946899 [Suillus americanus]